MFWNWNVFLKSLLFVLLGFLNGIAITFVYLTVDVDLSQFDGLLIVTGVLAGIIGLYAYSKKSSEINETLMKLIINHYIAFVIIVLTFLICIALLFSGTQYDDIAINLVAEGIGVLITVILLNYLFNRKEEYIWKKVKNRVHEQLGKQISGIYTEVSNIDTITKDEEAMKTLIDGNYGDLFNYRNNYIKYLLSTHFKFLDPSIDESLIIIQIALESIVVDVNIMKKRKEDELLKELIKEDNLFNHIKMSIAKISTEIDSLHEESNLEISI